MKIISKIKHIAILYPDKTAYMCDNGEITYKELCNESNKLALILKNYSNNIIVYGHKSVDMIICFLACLIAKKTYIPVDSTLPLNRVNDIIKITNPSLIIANEPLTKYKTYSLNDIPIVENNILDVNDIAYIIFTSGSTGKPKGVPIKYSNLENFTSWISYELKNKINGQCVLNQAAFNFDLSIADIYFSLTNGKTLVSVDDLTDYPKLFRLLPKINAMFVTPTFVSLLNTFKEFNPDTLSNLELIYFCGEVLSNKLVKSLFDKFKTVKIINAYGPTEATSAVSLIQIKRNMLKKALPIGNIKTAATKIIIKDELIYLTGKSVFDNYINNDMEKPFIDGEYCYNTGDLGYIENNYLYYKGRMDNQVKYKGYRIELEDIEKNIESISYIKKCIVIFDNKLIAYIVTEEEDTYKIKLDIKQILPKYMVPDKIIIKDTLPLNLNLKIDRTKLNENN